MLKVPKRSYTAEFKEAVVQRVKEGQGFGVVSRELGMSEQMLRNLISIRRRS
jgi:transposase